MALEGELDEPLDERRVVEPGCLPHLRVAARARESRDGVDLVQPEAILALERVGYDMERLPYLYKRAILTLPAGETVPRRRYEWLLWITDHVSGMTDRFAVAQYKTIRGISVG